MSNQTKKVYVGLSGGVDSSVSAYLLKEQGYDVTGVFIKVWHPDFLECDWKKDRRDAMKICAELNIPFKELDLEKEYKQHVVDYMIAEYKAGRTPNPDIMCNQHVKFGAFLDWALKDGADMVATGHYAQVREEDGAFKMFAGLDTNKDQTYFLWTLRQDQLKHVLFPIGHLEKPDVRKIAEKAGLLTAEKKDSQGVCFIGHIDLKEFLKHFIDEKPGEVLNKEGTVIGKHDGATFFTIGQRHGFTITEKGTNDQPYYIVAKDVEANTITVSHESHEQEGSINVIELENCNWVSDTPGDSKVYQARFRYRQKLQQCDVEVSGENVTVSFDEPQSYIPLGQSCVLYDGEECLGGGVIQGIR